MTDTRELIVEAADQLFYRQGFEHTSFADIAAAVQISRGNFYHHFKSKDDILDAVIELRLANTRHMLMQWEREAATPEECIRSYIHIVIANRAPIKRYGCPVGTLCTELAKLNHLSRRGANKVFTLFREWLGDQFRQLGKGEESDRLAMHVLAWSQGVATMANAYRDDTFVRWEVAQIHQWLNEIS